MESKEIQSLRQQNARLRKAIKDELGPGVWGLAKKSRFTHEEIVFLFGRVCQVFGIDYVKEIRSSYPDCICVKNGEEIAIEFESVLSAFRDHLRKDDLGKCSHIVCWEDDLEAHNPIKEAIRKYSIDIIELRTFYEDGKVKDRRTSLEWSLKDMQKFGVNKMRLLNAFVATGRHILTTSEISQLIGAKGRSLGGIIRGFSSAKEWLIRRHPKGWQFNKKYEQMVTRVLKDFGSDIDFT